MKVEQNKMVGVDYKLTVDGQIADQSRPGQPLEFIFGTGMLLPKFEEAILGKEIGEAVSFTLEPKDGYGELIADAVVDLPKNIFMVDGKLAEDILFVGSQVPMSDNQGNRMMGIVKEVGDETVKMDFNHPMAGKTLNFDVEVVSVRDVTPEDLHKARQGLQVCLVYRARNVILPTVSRKVCPRSLKLVFLFQIDFELFDDFHVSRKPSDRIQFIGL